jgi:hypothetical protein
MSKNVTMQSSVSTGRFASKALGKGKATKFALVEGISLSQRSATLISRMEQRGLKGDALRSAIAGSFATKRG